MYLEGLGERWATSVAEVVIRAHAHTCTYTCITHIYMHTQVHAHIHNLFSPSCPCWWNEEIMYPLSRAFELRRGVLSAKNRAKSWDH